MPAAPDSDRIAKELGDAIRARRLELALTQVEVAEQAGLDPAYLGRIERGEKNVSVARLVPCRRRPIHRGVSTPGWRAVTFKAKSFDEARRGQRRVTSRSLSGAPKPAISPYARTDMRNATAVQAATLRLLKEFPLGPTALVDAVLSSWNGLAGSRIGRARIGVDVFPAPQVVGAFLHELIPLDLRSACGDDWRGDVTASEKDIVYVPESRFSAEIKTSSHAKQIFGNRSFGQQRNETGKKEKSGYYLAVNFTAWSRDGSNSAAPGINMIRFGWLDHIDWMAQNASTGQAATLPPLRENCQLLTLFEVER